MQIVRKRSENLEQKAMQQDIKSRVKMKIEDRSNYKVIDDPLREVNQMSL